MKNYYLLLLLLLPMWGQAQQNVSGRVRDAVTGSPLPGVTIIDKAHPGTGTISAPNGSFQLPTRTGAILRFQLIGYEAQEVTNTNNSFLTVSLKTTAKDVDQVVVIGYGTARKRDLTGTIASIKGEEIVNHPGSNPVSAIQGKVAGVTITNSGRAGAAPTVRIRGVGSITNTNPLYVVDGVFHDNIDFLNTGDIASMEILKDPSSLAMFGVQGANGVIIITTKRARTGEMNVNFNAYAGVQHLDNKIKVTDATGFKTLYNEQLKNVNGAPFDYSLYTANTDWQDKIFRDAMLQSYNLSISTGTKNNRAYLSAGYYNQEGILKYDGFKKFMLHLNDEYQVNQHIRVGVDVSGSRWDRTGGENSLISNALMAAPIYAPYNAAGGYNASPSFQRAQVGNPVANTEIPKGHSRNYGYRFVGSAFAELKFLQHFTWKSVVYTDLGFNSSRGYTPKYMVGDSAQYNNITGVSMAKTDYQTFQADHTLSYDNAFRRHHLNLLAGFTAQYKGNDNVSGSRQSTSVAIPDNPDFWYLNTSPDKENQVNGGGGEEQAFKSYLFRASYAYHDRYLLNVSLRRDGTSKFGPNKRWGNFPAAGAAWVISEEPFMRTAVPAIDFLKMKVSWGRLGNDKIGNYLFYPVLNNANSAVFGDKLYPAVVPQYIANPDIHWEVMAGTDAGIELSMLKDRFSVEADYYHRKTSDILVTLDIPGAIGTTQSQTNAGTILNRGFEFSAGWKDMIGKNVRYAISANATTIKNEVLSIGNNIGYNITNTPARTIIGYPIGGFYGYIQDGIFQSTEEIEKSAQSSDVRLKPGDIRFHDVNGDGKIDDKDRTYIGSPTPSFVYGASFSVGWKGWGLEVETQGVSGNKIFMNRSRNKFAILNYETNRLNRWTGPGTSNKEPIMDDTRGWNFEPSTYFIESGDYFRIRFVQLSYNLNASYMKEMKIKSCRIFVNAQNLKTFTKASGYTPEVGGDSPVRFGVDETTYPLPATFMAGVNLNF
ncbi:TonB-dependent receptor [Chitinophaga sp.]|uniref:SusC/RagA family TonB-linked outer membrane protein n=1 Tax=Chitinophaga sp. TaxID=1869181 RepID=UPI002F93A304